jgi:hypothetical protein|tara:strand:+ start:5899 stop:6345 length:447 start_codon:yes stop_codon:yes gene_type:complete
MGKESSGGGGAPSGDTPWGEAPSSDSYKYDATYDQETGRPENAAGVRAEAEYDKWAAVEDSKMGDLSKTLEGLSGKLKDGSAATLAKSGALSGGISMGGSKGSYRDEANPYDVPSYLQSSQQYSNQTGKMVNALLKGHIRPRSIKSLI